MFGRRNKWTVDPDYEARIEDIQRRLVFEDVYSMLTERLGREPSLREILEYVYGN
jgi:hypothetical protein